MGFAQLAHAWNSARKIILARGRNVFIALKTDENVRRTSKVRRTFSLDSDVFQVYTAQIPRTVRPMLAEDQTAWARLQARILRDRTIEHQPNAIPQAKPITVGQGYSTIAWRKIQSASLAVYQEFDSLSSHLRLDDERRQDA